MKSTVFYRKSRNSSSARPACLTQAQRRRFGFDLGLVSASHAPPQKRAACLTRLVCCRFASAVPALRALPATALAPLSHMLRRGFFFVHGFATAGSSRKSHGPGTSTAGPECPAVSLVELEGSPRRRSRRASLRACSLVVDAAEATTACTTSK